MSAVAAAVTTRAETYEQREQRRREDRAQFRVRALELAFDRGLVGTAHLVSENTSLGVRTYHVPNADRRGDGHRVSVCGQTVMCDCPAGQYDRGRSKIACAHAGAAIHYERQRLSTAESNCDWDWWMAGGEW